MSWVQAADMTLSADEALVRWLDELVSAVPADRRTVAIAGLDAGLGFAKVRCGRCRLSLNWQSAHSHLVKSEASHRLQHPEAGPLHQAGDLRPPVKGEPDAVPPVAWRWAWCSSSRCNAQIVWARTAGGSRMPVDAWPDRAGTVLLVDSGDDEATAAGARGALPLAIVVRDEIRATLRAEELDKLHVTHFATCKRPARRS